MPGSGLGNSRPFKLVTGGASTDKTLVQAGYVELSALALSGVASAQFLHLYDAPTAASVTVGSTAAAWAITIPVSGSVNMDFIQPIRFMTGLVIAVTSDNPTDAGTSNDAANAVICLGIS